MKPAAFDYLRAENTEEALAARAEHGGEAKVMGGGQSLMPILNMRLARPGIVIDISRASDLGSIAEKSGMIEIGAAVTQAELEGWDGLAGKAPLLSQAIPYIGHFQTRNRGTVCGSLCHSDPSSELPLSLATLEGEVVLQSRRGSRSVKAGDFQTGMLQTDVADDEICVAARFPVAETGAGYAFHEIARRHGDFAIVALAAVAKGDSVRLGVGGVADTPTVRDWDNLDDGTIDDALNEFAWDLGGSDDIHATARYRRELVRRLGRKVIEEARNARTG